ncbi:MAG: hypothetical protein HC836_18040 [Richelia sp. RM2_1_2]|nr:hypothetical protein [Richelia sp. RM1_1_1]NJO60099.1 hypothetical protein [Richelia sp. RM2_1_2]
MHSYDRRQAADGERDIENVDGGLGVAQTKSRSYGVNSNKVCDPNREGGNSSRAENSNRESSSIGGITRQLKELRDLHLATMEANEQNLKERLNSNNIHKQQVLESIQKIETQLKELGLPE